MLRPDLKMTSEHAKEGGLDWVFVPYSPVLFWSSPSPQTPRPFLLWVLSAHCVLLYSGLLPFISSLGLPQE